MIRTPDQRLRVFISSTLKELADERNSVRSSVESLRLIPVMFELGARPHPPKDLYQAYLLQSNIFIGIYWQSYGWIAEHETISGIEDEFRLSGKLPRLIYVKEPALEREIKLNGLLDSVRSEGDVSYKSFSTSEELQKLVTDDLAILISERFYSAENQNSEVSDTPKTKTYHSNLPSILPELIGREVDIENLRELIIKEQQKLITVTGPGGIGKTFLTKALAGTLKDHFEDGIFFIDLSDIKDEKSVFIEIAALTGIQISEPENIVRQISDFISSLKILLILDNFEHLSSSTSEITKLSLNCPGLTIIITSRDSLNMSFENEYRVSALGVPAIIDEFNKIISSPSVKLFYKKARSADNNFNLNENNIHDVAEICRILEGIPLAINLAAAKVRIFSPGMILNRLSKKLLILSGGSSDAPARHKTMRAAIEWSIDLLNKDEKILFRRLAVFVNGFDYEALESICTDCSEGPDELAESLISKNIIKKDIEIHGITKYIMPGMILEYAKELFDDSDEKENIKIKHAYYYLNSAKKDIKNFSGENISAASKKWGADAENVIEAAITFLQNEKYSELVNLIFSLWQLFWIFDYESELEKKIDINEIIRYQDKLSEEDKGKLLWLIGASALGKGDYENAEKYLNQAKDIFESSGNKNGYAWAFHLITSMHAASQQENSNQEIINSLKKSAMLFRETGDFWGECSVLQNSAALETLMKHYSRALKLYDEYEILARKTKNIAQEGYINTMRGWIYINTRKYEQALNHLRKGLQIFKDGTTPEALSYSLLILSYYYFKTKNEINAFFIAGAQENIKTKYGITQWQMLSSVTELISDKIRNNNDILLRDAYDRGMKMGVYKACGKAYEMLLGRE